MSTLRERVEGLVAKWREAKFDHVRPCFCPYCLSSSIYHAHAEELAAALAAEGQGDADDDVILHAKRVEGHWYVDVDKRLAHSGLANMSTLEEALKEAIEMALENRQFRLNRAGENLDLSTDRAAAPSLHKEALPQATELLIRMFLWEGHGHNDALYGDDGEMHCGICHCDFKRENLHECVEKARVAALEVGLKKMALHKEARPAGCICSEAYGVGPEQCGKHGAALHKEGAGGKRDSTAPGLSAKQVEEAIMAEVSTQFLTYDHFTLHYHKIPALTERLNAVLRCVEDARSQTSGDSVRGIGTATRAIGSVEGSDATSIPETPLAAAPAGRAEQEPK